MRALVILAVVQSVGGLWEHKQGAMQAEDHEDGNCIASTRPPKKPRALEFCSWHLKNSCCLPTHDTEAHGFFSELSDLGIPCSRSEHKIKHNYLRLRYWSCFMCDPQEPEYRFNVYDGYAANNIEPVAMPPYSLSVVLGNGPASNFAHAGLSNGSAIWKGPSSGDGISYNVITNKWEVAIGATLTESAMTFSSRPETAEWGAGATVARNEYAPVKLSWRVCRSFLNAMWNASSQPNQVFGRVYDDCGLKLDGNSIIPSTWFTGETGAEDFLNTLHPPGFTSAGGFSFHVVDNLANATHCSACSVSNNMCVGCPNGCTFSTQTGQCEAFDRSVTPCFSGEGVPLPGTNDAQALVSCTISFALLLLFIAL